MLAIKKRPFNWIIHKVWRLRRKRRAGQLLPVCHGHGSCVSAPSHTPSHPPTFVRLLRRRMAAGSTRWQVALRTADNFRRRLSRPGFSFRFSVCPVALWTSHGRRAVGHLLFRRPDHPSHFPLVFDGFPLAMPCLGIPFLFQVSQNFSLWPSGHSMCVFAWGGDEFKTVCCDSCLCCESVCVHWEKFHARRTHISELCTVSVGYWLVIIIILLT